MAEYHETPHRKIKTPEASKPDTICADLKKLVESLDFDVVTGQGTEAERPVAAQQGRIWMIQNDIAAKNGLIYYDNGTEWVGLNSNIKEFSAVAAEVTTLQGIAVTTASIGAYSTGTWTNGTEVEPSATRPAIVVLTAGCTTGSEGYFSLHVTVGSHIHVVGFLGFAIPGVSNGKRKKESLTIFVPAKAKWKIEYETNTLEPNERTYSTILL